MSWTFGNAGPTLPASGSGSAQTSQGPDLEDIQTDGLGFTAIAGETKLQLLPQAWPSDRLPPPTASLLSVSSAKGLLAAAGPDTLVVATTDSVRQAYTSEAPAENGAKPINPLARIQIPRVSQVSFSSDGSCLVIAAEEGGGLAVYDTQALQQSQQEPAFQLATNGIPVRVLAANPAPEFFHLFAVVLGGGQLLIADLKERKLVSGSSGTYFKEGVSCVSWSAKGKQMVAGLEDGTAAQFDHGGNQKASIPAPPQLEGQTPMTGIYWLANDDFLTIHTPVSGNSDSTYHILHREKGSGSFSASKFMGDPTPAFGMRHPAHHFISRLKSFPPNLEDLLLISSSAGTDIGVITKSTAPLSNDVPADKIVNTYTTTAMANDARRAQMPMSSDGMGDTSPIGQCLDLSSKEMVKRPLATDDMEETASPLPALMILDNEGKLSTWWVMYTESIRQKTAYPGLVSVQSQGTPVTQSTAFQSTPSTASTQQQQSTPAFGSSTFGQPARPAFGSASTPGFGSSAALGSKPSPWGSSSQTTSGQTPSGQASSAFGKPAFGATSSLGGATAAPAFGSAGGLGGKSSPWGTAASPQSSAPVFGQTAAFGASAGGPSGFAKFGQSSGSPFGTATSTDANKASPFAKFGGDKPSSSPFASSGGDKPAASSFTSTSGGKPSTSPFGNLGGDKPASSPFANLGGDKPAASPFSAFGSNTQAKQSPFSTFGQANKDAPAQPSFGSTVTLPSTTGSSFGQPSSGFSFGKPSAPQSAAVSREATMMDEESAGPSEQNKSTSGTPLAGGFGGFKLNSTFKGDGSAKDDLPRSANAGTSLFGNSFGNILNETAKQPTTPDKQPPKVVEPSATPASPPKQTPSLFGQKPDAEKPAASTDDAPLPPDFTKPSKKPAADSFNDIPLPPDPTPKIKQEETDDAPLPPDFITKPKKPVAEQDLPPIAGSPPVDLAEAPSSGLSAAASDYGDEEDDQEGDEDEEGDESVEEEDWEDEDGEEGEEGEEDEEDEEEELETPQVTQQSIEKAASTPFGSRLAFPSNAPSAEKPQGSPLPSTTPAGLPKGPMFAPPQKESPRSPSPIRSISTPAARPATRQVPTQPISLQPRAQANTSARPSSSVRSSKEPAPPQESETTDLSDDEDARIKALLESEIEPTKVLDPFTAHQDYIGTGEKSGLGGQIENVYRDINSMIDTLGLNARSLQAFVQGHEQFRKKGGRTQDDLDDEDWCLVEVEDLDRVEDQIDQQVEGDKFDNLESLLSDLANLNTETLRLRTRASEVRRQLALHSDPEKRAAQRNAPLDTETEMQQSQLRQSLTKVQKLLQEAEEQISVLRAELASIPSKGSSASSNGPTVEAVTNTIMKMTAMIEQKSGDVDVLEAQIRRLPQGLAGLSLDDEEQDLMRSSVSSLRSSRRGLPVSRSMNALATPVAVRHQHRRSVINGGEKMGMSGMLGSRFRTPPQSGRRSMILSGSSPDQSMLGQSMISVSERRKMADVTDEEIADYHTRTQHRRKVLDALKETVEKKGTRFVSVA
ncbi:putative nuclear pore complex subunit NUP214 [Elsinoe australis]|uniref:Putative nuclear pore complex subunit NUP214 n=1 Tax=Elsinoe australis TaxID=40998 RepID=A0A4U7BAV9_9PEZI|nr:putative nuclear pore complex subunit NUP214 [Elsinoe australis]